MCGGSASLHPPSVGLLSRAGLDRKCPLIWDMTVSQAIVVPSRRICRLKASPSLAGLSVTFDQDPSGAQRRADCAGGTKQTTRTPRRPEGHLLVPAQTLDKTLSQLRQFRYPSSGKVSAAPAA